MPLSVRLKKEISFSMVVLLLVSCVSTHRYTPAGNTGSEAPVKRYDLLTFHVAGSVPPGFRGDMAVRKAMGEHSPFINLSEASEVPSRGVHCKVELIPSKPGMAASLFGYLSFFTLFAFPSLSLKEGYTIRYHLYIDREHQQKVYPFQVKRKSGIWLALAPFIWMNLLTETEDEVVEKTVREFFAAADTVLNSVEENRIGDRF